MSLSRDAIIFGIGYLQGPRSTLSFGGEGAAMRITDRARAALDELLSEGYAVPRDPDDEIPGREFYRGTGKEPNLWELAADSRIDPSSAEMKWTTFERIEPEAEHPGP